MVRDDAETLRELLEEERAALRAGALDRLAGLLERKETVMARFAADGRECSAADAAALKADAERNGALLEAARRGLRHVIDRMAESGRVARQLDTYDARGRRMAITPQPGSLQRKL